MIIYGKPTIIYYLSYIKLVPKQLPSLSHVTIMGIEILNFGENWFLIESTFVIVEFLEGSYGRK